MKTCKDIKNALIDYSTGDISSENKQRVEKHLKVCEHCSAEQRHYLQIFDNAQFVNKESEALLKTIDWGRNAQEISRNIRSGKARSSRAFTLTFNILNWKALAPITAAVLLLGIWFGYLLFHSYPGVMNFPEKSAQQQFSLSRLEAALAQKEVSGYFQEAQLVVTDLMRQCDVNGDTFHQDQLNRKRVKLLLNRSKYFSQDLENPRLLSSRSLLKKIEWLLYEILTLDDTISCRQLQQLQDYIRQERLLLKIRLIKKDVTEV